MIHTPRVLSFMMILFYTIISCLLPVIFVWFVFMASSLDSYIPLISTELVFPSFSYYSYYSQHVRYMLGYMCKYICEQNRDCVRFQYLHNSVFRFSCQKNLSEQGVAPIYNVPLFHTEMIPIIASPRNRGSSDQLPSRLVLSNSYLQAGHLVICMLG